MADKNHKVAYCCAWCEGSFHVCTDEHSMAPIRVHTDRNGLQFDSLFCLRMHNQDGNYDPTKSKDLLK
jgi:hypothetical protein